MKVPRHFLIGILVSLPLLLDCGGGGGGATSSIAPPVLHQVIFQAGKGGTVEGIASQSVHHGGSSSAVMAVPQPGHAFLDWTGQGFTGSRENPLVLRDVRSSLVLTANFALKTHSVQFKAELGGTIEGETLQQVPPGGTATAVRAVPKPGFRFLHWAGPGIPTTTDNPLTLKGVSSDLTLTAYFQASPHTVRFEARSGGTLTGSTTQIVPHGGSTTAVTAVADPGSVFSTWSGAEQGLLTSPQVQVANVQSDMTICAHFSPQGTRVSSVEITPNHAKVLRGEVRPFSARVKGTGTPNPDVVWKAHYGQIDPYRGLYTAPAKTVHDVVTATSVQDPTVFTHIPVDAVNVQNPTIIRFTASSMSMAPGASVRLGWQVAAATSVEISPGIGRTTASFADVSPRETTRYLLTAKNELGQETTQSLIVQVEGDPRLVLSSNVLDMMADDRSTAMLQVSGSLASQATIYVNDLPVAASNSLIRTKSPGLYRVVAKAGDATSNVLIIQARPALDVPIVELPVIFHVVHFGETAGTGRNLGADTLSNCLKALNDAFGDRIGSSNPNAADTRIRFRLVKLDPQGVSLTEPGIHRIHGGPYDNGSKFANLEWDKAGDRAFGPNETWELMGATFWNPNEYLNVWFLPEIPGNGAATLPWCWDHEYIHGLNALPSTSNATPTPEFFDACHINSDAGTKLPDIIVHEMGHKLGLHHPFSEDGCITSDYCVDTFSYQFATKAPCPDNTGLVSATNHMDYACGRLLSGLEGHDTFTYDQAQRMRVVLRQGVWMKHLPSSKK